MAPPHPPSGSADGSTRPNKPATDEAENDLEIRYITTQTTLNESLSKSPSVPSLSRASTYRAHVHHIATKFWLWESSACLLAVALHLGLIGILKTYDRRPVTDWHFEFTLNSTIAFFNTVIKAAALIPVASCLGQLKWKRFRTHHRLLDMEYYDSASRGFLGSLNLLFRLRFWHLASIGALVTVVSLAMDTVTQNVVRVYDAPIAVSNLATMPRSNGYKSYRDMGSGEQPGDQLPRSGMITTISYGMTFLSSQFRMPPELVYDCPSGNCTFPTFQSLDIQSDCQDVTSKLQTDNGTSVYLPSEGEGDSVLSLDKKGDILKASSSSFYPSDTKLFQDVGPLINNFRAIYVSPNDTSITAAQCVIYWGIMTYRGVNITRDHLNDNIHEKKENLPSYSPWTNTSAAARTSYKQLDIIHLHPSECWINGTKITDPSTEPVCAFTVHPKAQLGLQNFFTDSRDGMTGTVYRTPQGSDFTTFFANSLSSTIQTGVEGEKGRTPYKMITRIMKYTHYMMSLGIRNVDNESPPAGGTVWRQQSHFDIQFRFLTVSHIVVVGSLVFFLLTVWLSRKEQVWKSSELAVLFHGLARGDQEAVGEVSTLRDMHEVARCLRVSTVQTEFGTQLATTEFMEKKGSR